MLFIVKHQTKYENASKLQNETERNSKKTSAIKKIIKKVKRLITETLIKNWQETGLKGSPQ